MGTLSDAIARYVTNRINGYNDSNFIDTYTREAIKNRAEDNTLLKNRARSESIKNLVERGGYTDSYNSSQYTYKDSNGKTHSDVYTRKDVEEYLKKNNVTPKTQQESTEESENSDDFIEFTYVPGDTFGQKILDLGIGTDNGLWGENGDVAFYTQQLIDGGYLDDNGNVKLGVPIRLKKRK